MIIIITTNHGRKFRSQTSDNMDRWKAEMERVREKRKIRREKSRRERVRRKKMQMREKVGKSRFTVFFQWFVAPEGRKVGSLKRRVRSQLARWEMKNCTPLWREAHFQVKMNKTHHVRTTFGSWDVEKVHAVVARSTFRSQNVKNTEVRTTFGSWDVEKVHAVLARSTFRSQMCRFAKMILSDRCRATYDLASIFRGRCSTLDRWTGKIAKRIGTSLSALHSTFHFWRKSRRILRFWCLALRKMRKSRRIASFRMLSSSKNEKVSQNCSVLDVLMFKHDGSLAEFLRFWSCR